MIEVLPAQLSRGIQLIGLTGAEGEQTPSRALFAFRTAHHPSPFHLQGVWLKAEPQGDLSAEALRDLVVDGLSSAGLRKQGGPSLKRCPICGEEAPPRILTAGGRAVCEDHLGDFWEDHLRASIDRPEASSCPRCGEAGRILWNVEASFRCTRCLVAGLDGNPQRWLFVEGSPLAWGAEGELRIFLEVWKRFRGCMRCGSREIRIRKICLDFPRADAPIYPIWEIFREDRAPEEERKRAQQLDAYTQGMLRVTLECPQCGYLQHTFTGGGHPRVPKEDNPASYPPFPS